MPARRRTNFPKDVKEAALERADGRCEHIDEAGERCPCALQDHYYQFAHVIADRIGGRPTLENCRVWCTPCHRGEFSHDMAVIAQTRRLEEQRVGVSGTRRPMAGSRFSSESRGFDGFVRDRDTGALRSRPWVIDVRASDMAAHPKEHPLAGRRVVMNSDLAHGAIVYVVDWLDRIPRLTWTCRPSSTFGFQYRARLAKLGINDDYGAVVVRDHRGGFLVPASELPTYDPVPVGSVS